MLTVTEKKYINDTTRELLLSNGHVIALRTDIPFQLMMDGEIAKATESVVSMHENILSKLTSVIADDSYIQIGSTDTLLIAVPDEHYSLAYLNGTFGKHSPLFYLNWATEGQLIEVTGDEEHLAKFLYVAK